MGGERNRRRFERRLRRRDECRSDRKIEFRQHGSNGSSACQPRPRGRAGRRQRRKCRGNAGELPTGDLRIRDGSGWSRHERRTWCSRRQFRRLGRRTRRRHRAYLQINLGRGGDRRERRSRQPACGECNRSGVGRRWRRGDSVLAGSGQRMAHDQYRRRRRRSGKRAVRSAFWDICNSRRQQLHGAAKAFAGSERRSARELYGGDGGRGMRFSAECSLDNYGRRRIRRNDYSDVERGYREIMHRFRRIRVPGCELQDSGHRRRRRQRLVRRVRGLVARHLMIQL